MATPSLNKLPPEVEAVERYSEHFNLLPPADLLMNSALSSAEVVAALDKAVKDNKPLPGPSSDLRDPSVETEEDGIRAEAIRRLKVRRMLTVPRGRTSASSASPSATPGKTGSPSSGKSNTSE